MNNMVGKMYKICTSVFSSFQSFVIYNILQPKNFVILLILRLMLYLAVVMDFGLLSRPKANLILAIRAYSCSPRMATSPTTKC